MESDSLRDERAVISGLTPDAQRLLKRVLQIERSRLHVRDADLTDEIVNEVRTIIP